MSLPFGLVKICGLREPEQGEWAADAGATLIGLNFVPVAWRRVSVEEAMTIADRARSHSNRPRIVGLFLDQSAAEINQIADQVSLDFLQIHQGHVQIDWAALNRPVFPVLRPKPGMSIESLERPIGMIRRSGASVPAVIVDAWHPTLAGGTGEQSDWNVAATLARNQPVILAGGLKPDIVAEAIQTVHPFGVDVSSGVETDRIKDRAKITAFIQNATAAFTPNGHESS